MVVDKPLAWIGVHAGIGYLGILIGVIAMFLRLPWIKRWRGAHAAVGKAWIMLMYFMPILAMYITAKGPGPRNATGVLVGYFIFSMYAAIVIGYFAIQLHKHWRDQALDASNWGSHSWAKVLHGAAMLYAWVMLLGAGIAFSASFRERLYTWDG